MLTINKKTIYIYSLITLLTSCCLQSITLLDINGASLKFCHIVSLSFLLILHNKIKLPNKHICTFEFLIVISAFINTNRYGISSLILNYIFGFFILMIILNIDIHLKYNEWTKIFKITALIMGGIIVINDFIQRNEIISFLNNPYGHPLIDFIFGGGPNLESTWMSLFAFSFLESKFFFGYVMFALGLSAIYASRVGMLIVFLAIILRVLENNTKNKLMNIFLVSVPIIISILIIINSMGLFDYILLRFEDLGNDAGSKGRLLMWQFAMHAILNNPLGVGIGNSLNYLREATGIIFEENNLHNLYMQMFIEIGWIGGVYYLLIITTFIYLNRKNYKNAFVAMLFTYILISLLQFRGGEPIIFFILGIHLYLDREKRHKNTI